LSLGDGDDVDGVDDADAGGDVEGDGMLDEVLSELAAFLYSEERLSVM
jgi:hypothetical protein